MADPMDDQDRDRTVAERAGEEPPEPTAEELFPMGSLAGEGPTPQTIIKKGLRTTLTVSLSRAEVPNPGGGLFDPGRYGRALVTYLPGQLHPLPLREDAGNPTKVTGWKIRQDLSVTHVAPASDPAALILGQFEELLEVEPGDAAALCERLLAMTSEALGKPVGAAA